MESFPQNIYSIQKKKNMMISDVYILVPYIILLSLENIHITVLLKELHRKVIESIG